MDSFDFNPVFSSARGTVQEWNDPQGSRLAAERIAGWRYQHQMAYVETMREQHPDVPEEQFLPYPRPSPHVADVWEYDPLTHQVSVLPPSSSLQRSFRSRGGKMVPAGERIVNRRSSRFQAFDGDRVYGGRLQDNRAQDRGDLGSFCFGPHDPEALALLQPRCIVYGRNRQGISPKATTVLDRPAFVLRLQRTVPLSDPGILGHQFNPTVMSDAEEIEVVVDQERAVILEWRALFDGEVYERHWFVEIAFDEPLSEDDFAIMLD